MSEVPRGWTGRWTDTRGPNGERVWFSRSGNVWLASLNGEKIGGRYESRDYAIRKVKEAARSAS